MPSWGDILERINEAKERLGQEGYDVVRQHYVSNLADETGNDVILYSTGWSAATESGANTSITDADIQGFMEALSGMDGDALDLVIHSPGGKPEAAEQIVEYLRDKYPNIRVFVPQAARSAATLISCAADEIVMGKHSSLGPIDPQLTLRTGLGVRMVPAQSILDQFDMAREEYDETGEIGRWGPILQQYGPSLIAECEDAKDYARELAKEWTDEFMDTSHVTGSDPEDVAEALLKREEHKSHSRPIMRDEAEEIGLNVSSLEQDQDLQDAVLSVYHAAQHTHNGTGAVKIIENHNNDSFVHVEGQQQQPEEEN
jgi:hypothetical protein